MRVKTDSGRTKDVDITEVTPENYIVPANEKHLYHAVIEVKKFDQNTGKRLSQPRIQKFGKKAFENGVLSNLKKQSYTVTILHDPNDYLQEKAAKEAEAKQAKEAAAAEAKTKAAAAERAALKAELLAELREKGIIPAAKAETKAGRPKATKTEDAAKAETKAGAEEATEGDAEK